MKMLDEISAYFQNVSQALSRSTAYEATGGFFLFLSFGSTASGSQKEYTLK